MADKAILAAACCVVTLLPLRQAIAQAPTRTSTRLEALSKRVDEVSKATADVPALMTVVQRIDSELAGLRKKLDEREGAPRRAAEVESELTVLEGRLDDLDLRLSSILLQRAGGASAGYGEGFGISSPDGRFLLNILGVLQVAYLGRFFSAEPGYPNTTLGEKRSSFSLRRVRLIFAGHLVDPRLGYRLALEYGAAADSQLLDAFASFHWHRLANLRIGLMKVPYGRFVDVRAAKLQFVDRGGAVRSFTAGRQVGALVRGELFPDRRWGQLRYQIGVYNGAGSGSLENDDLDFLYAARLVYEPLRSLAPTEVDDRLSDQLGIAVGASFFFNRVRTDAALRAGATEAEDISRLQDQDADGAIDRLNIFSAAAELVAHFRGIASQSELFYRVEDPGSVGEQRKSWGAYTQLGAHHPSGLELAARYGFWKGHGFGKDSRTVSPSRTHEVAGLVALVLWEQRCKAQLEYSHSWFRDLMGDAPGRQHLRAHQVQAQLQVAY